MTTQPQPHVFSSATNPAPAGLGPPRRPILSGRGLAAGLIAVGLGLVLTVVGQGGLAWGDAAVLGFVFLGAMVGGSAADRIADRRPLPVGQDGWMTVEVSSRDPWQTADVMVRPRTPPAPRPERRRLSRVARGRRRELMDSALR
jgi:hypothetical protein